MNLKKSSVSTLAEYVTVKHVAEKLQIHVSQVYRLIDAGRLRAVSLTDCIRGGRFTRRCVRVQLKSVHELLDASMVEAPIEFQERAGR